MGWLVFSDCGSLNEDGLELGSGWRKGQHPIFSVFPQAALDVLLVKCITVLSA